MDRDPQQLSQLSEISAEQIILTDGRSFSGCVCLLHESKHLKLPAKQTHTGVWPTSVLFTRLVRSGSHGEKEARQGALLLRSCCTPLLQKRTDEGKQARLLHEHEFEFMFICEYFCQTVFPLNIEC